MISLNNVSLSFGGKLLFQNVSFFIGPRDKIGLVGRNGAGKSTLFKVLLDQVSADEGQVARQGNLTMGHLKQELGTLRGRSVFEEASTAFTELQEIEAALEEIHQQIETRTDYESEEYMALFDKVHEYENRYQMLDGDSRDKNIELILKGLGFSESEFAKEISEFSGGWQMRVELAKILLRKPDLLLLDEPTNHLDIDSIQWLERFLKNYPGAILLISHDREFLDQITNRTVEISNRQIYDYNVSYTQYKLQRAERMETQISAAANQQRKIDDMERFVERFKAKATKAKQAQSKMKALDKIERIVVDTDDSVSLNFYFPEAPRAGALPFDCVDGGKSYGAKKVLEKVNFEIERGDRIAFIGRNGMGKSTLAKMMMGLIEHDGTLKKGYNTIIGYFAQDNIADLDPNKTVFQTIDDLATGDMRTQVRNLLGAFLFSGDDVDKKIRVLSGGEKSRLSLVRLLLKQNNFLILDEPTNHLDMQSKDILKEALLKFNGTYVLVSHDREFLRGLCTKVFEFDKGTVKVHLNTIDEYLIEKQSESIQSLDFLRSTAPKKEPKKAQPTDSDKREADKIRNKREKELKMLEANIESLENEILELEATLGKDGYVNTPNYASTLRDYDNRKNMLAKTMKDWERLVEELEAS